MSVEGGLSQSGHRVELQDPEKLPAEDKILETGSNFTEFSSFAAFCDKVNVSAFLPKFKRENGVKLKKLLPLYPLPHQIRCIQSTLKRYRETKALANVTPTGLGKTFFAMIIAYILDLKLFVVGTDASEIAWKSQAEMFGIAGKTGTYTVIDGENRIENGVSVANMKTLDTIIGSSGQFYANLDTKFLETVTYGKIAGLYVNSVTKKPSEVFKKLVDIGILLVFDEAHQIKNQGTDRTVAATVLADYINFEAVNTRSRILYMSATLVDTEKGAANMTRLLGIVPPPPPGETDDLSYREKSMYQWIASRGQIINQSDKHQSNYTPTFIDIFGYYVKPGFIDRMGVIQYPRYLQSYGSYLYLRIKQKSLIDFVRPLDEIEWIVSTEEEGGKVEERATKLTAINHSLSAFESSLAPEIANFVVKVSNECPYAKVVIAFFYHKSINKFVAKLDDLGYESRYILMRGEETQKYNVKKQRMEQKYPTLSPGRREAAINSFVGPQNSVKLVDGVLRRDKVIFILQQTTAESISLHDVFGDGPTIFISCFNYQFQKLVQAAGRVIRSGMLSPAFVFWAVPDMLLAQDVDPEYEELSPVEKYHIEKSLNYKNISARLSNKSLTVKKISDVETEVDEEDEVGVSKLDAAVQFDKYQISRLNGLNEGQTHYCRSAIIVIRRDQMIELFNKQKELGQWIFTFEIWKDFFSYFYNIELTESLIVQMYHKTLNANMDGSKHRYQSQFFIRGLASETDYNNAKHFSALFNADALEKKKVDEDLNVSITEAIL